MVQFGLMHGGAPRSVSAARVPTPKTVIDRILGSALLILYALTLALGVGLGSAYWAVNGGYPFGSIRVGPWTIWSRIGFREMNPYARAVLARTGDIPLGVGEGLLLTAGADDGGQPLDPRCVYRIGGVTPQTRLWTITLYNGDAKPVATDLMRSGFTSAEILRDADGRFSIVLSRDAQPGNWLRMPESGRVSLALRLYDTSVAASSAAIEARTLPSIQHLECAP
ncbi:MAG TPA: DUF1214 domain-containing protein [Beijerinckiaceae bacterium]|nr:DUF1214 domain-containing protein [Beijerinckiaceae bacterium]